MKAELDTTEVAGGFAKGQKTYETTMAEVAKEGEARLPEDKRWESKEEKDPFFLKQQLDFERD